jgi:hypothetical protein
MGTKTISLRDEAYERLRAAKRSASESFSDVVMRAVWPDQPLSAGDYLRLVRDRGAVYTPSQLDRIDEATAADQPPEDKWRRG